MKIAFITYTSLPAIGGAQIMLHNVAGRLKDRGHEPIVFTHSGLWRQLGKERKNLEYEIQPLYVPGIYSLLKSIPRAYMAFMSLYFDRIQKKYGFDAWFAWMAYPMGVVVGNWAQSRGIPHGIRCAGEDIQMFPEIGYGARLDGGINRLVERYLPGYDYLVALAGTVAEEYRKIKVEEKKIMYIPCGVDSSRFGVNSDKKETRRKYGIPDDHTVFITMGRNHPKKGYRFLVEAARMLKEKTAAAFTVVFVGKDMAELEEYGRKLEVGNNLMFVKEKGAGGTRYDFPSDEVIALYKASDICAFPTLMETFALIPVEAWAAGIPVVTTDAPGTGEIVTDGVDALVAPAGDSNALAEKMMILMNDRSLARRLVDAGHRNVQEKYDWERVIEDWERLFKNIHRVKEERI